MSNKEEINEAQSRRCSLHKGCVLIKVVNGPIRPFYSGTSCLKDMVQKRLNFFELDTIQAVDLICTAPFVPMREVQGTVIPRCL